MTKRTPSCGRHPSNWQEVDKKDGQICRRLRDLGGLCSLAHGPVRQVLPCYTACGRLPRALLCTTAVGRLLEKRARLEKLERPDVARVMAIKGAAAIHVVLNTSARTPPQAPPRHVLGCHLDAYGHQLLALSSQLLDDPSFEAERASSSSPSSLRTAWRVDASAAGNAHLDAERNYYARTQLWTNNLHAYR